MNGALSQQIEALGQWRQSLSDGLELYRQWLENNRLGSADIDLRLFDLQDVLKQDKISIAFVAEFSRGKSELINSIFFSDYKRRLLPSDAGRTMCPTELFYDDRTNESYIRFNRALAYQQIGDRNRAIMGYGDAIRINPSNGEAYLNRGIAFLDTRKYASAEADFTRSHELDPKNAWPLANRGITYAWMNDRARAENDFAAAKAIDPDNQVVARGEALLAMHAGNFERAAAILTTALSRDPKDDWARSMRAKISF